MRIALLTTQFPGARLGGIGTYTLRAAAALAQAGHDPHVFTLALPPDAREAARRGLPANVTIHETPDLASAVAAAGGVAAQAMAAILAAGEGMYRLATAWQIYATVKHVHAATPFGVLEAPEFEGLGLPFMLAPLEERPAVITHLHSGSPINRAGNNIADRAEDLAIDALEAAAILGADAVCAPTRAVVEATSATLLPGVALDVAVLPLPIPVADGPFVPPPAGGPVVYVGRVERLKGAAVLAGALPVFLQACPGARVEIIGPDTPTAAGGGSMVAAMKAALPAPFRERVIFAGEKNATEVAAALRRASLLVVPSLFENFSQVACEALATGRGVVTSSGIGPAEFVGDAGVIFERGSADALAHALVSLWDNPQRVQDLARRACDRARRELSTAATLPQRIAFYQAAAERPRTDPDFSRLPRQFLPMLAQARAMGRHGIAAAPSDAALAEALTPGRRLLKIMESLGPASQVLLYGAGRHTARLLAERYVWESRGHAVIGLIDDHPRFAETPTHLGLPVFSRAAIEARAAREAIVPIVLSTDTFTDQFMAQTRGLRELGVRVEPLYGGPDEPAG